MERGDSLSNDVAVLRQLVQSFEEGFVRLEDAFRKKDFENFNKAKKFMLQVQDKIGDSLK